MIYRADSSRRPETKHSITRSVPTKASRGRREEHFAVQCTLPVLQLGGTGASPTQSRRAQLRAEHGSWDSVLCYCRDAWLLLGTWLGAWVEMRHLCLQSTLLPFPRASSLLTTKPAAAPPLPRAPPPSAVFWRMTADCCYQSFSYNDWLRSIQGNYTKEWL